MQIIRRIWNSLRELTRCWEGVDRIRVGCSEGRLLRISTGSRVLIDGRLFDVVSRVEQTAVLPHAATYDLRSEDDSARLTVSLTEAYGMWNTSVELCHEDNVERLCDGDVTVLKPTISRT